MFSVDFSAFLSVFVAVLFPIALYCGNLVSQEFGGAVPCVGYQRFLFRQIELEFFKQECSESLFDCFCLILWSNEC